MRISIATLSLKEKTGGGSHHNCAAQIRYLASRGHEVSMHALSEGGSAADGIRIVEHELVGLSFRAFNRALANLLRSLEAETDIFFLYGQSLAWGAGMYRKRGGKVPVAVYLDNYLDSMFLTHDDAALEAGGIRRMRDLVYRIKRFAWDKMVGVPLSGYVDRFIAVSPFVERVYVRFGFPARAFSVVPNVFDFPNAAARTRSDDGRIRLLYVGRLSYDKGSDLLVPVMSSLAHEGDFELRIVGDGPRKGAIERAAAREGLSSRVTFAPWTDAAGLAREYADADILLHPARWPEPFGRTIVEAMRAGVPVVVPRDGGAAWVAGDAAETFENENVASVVSAIVFLNDATVRAAKRACGKERAGSFAPERVGPRLEETLATAACSAVPCAPPRTEGVLRFVRFVVAGGSATGANLATLALLQYAGLWYLLASVGGFLSGLVVSFALQKLWTFRDRRRDVLGRQLVAYLVIMGGNTLLNTVFVYALVERLALAPLVSQAIASFVIAFESFFLYRAFVFRTHPL